MILKGSQRGGGGQLAAHLMNMAENDHVTLHEVRGFMAQDLGGALGEAHAISKGTRCRQFMFSLSINPPKDADAGVESLLNAADRAGEALGLKDQPRAVVVHEKNGRRHAHVVWSRIDADEMKAINLPFFKDRLNRLSKELYLEHGWELPEGHRTNGWKNPLNFSLAEWQQAKRLDLDPREVKQIFRSAYARSDGQNAFRHALEEHGYYLAKGDRRGFVAVDMQGEALSVSRWAGVATKDLNARLGDPSALPSVAQRRAELQRTLSTRLREHIRAGQTIQAQEVQPLKKELSTMVTAQRAERERLAKGQDARWRKEAKVRAERLHKGIRGVWELLSGKAKIIRRQNEGEAFAAFRRDRSQREDLFLAQIKDRRVLQARMDTVIARHRSERLAVTKNIVSVLHHTRMQTRGQEAQGRSRDRGHELELRR
jgi:hypothetical protein